jgi:hypothetical protein
MRRNPTPPITPQLYRRFAAATVAIAALLAFFANGENQEAVAAASAAGRPATRQPAVEKLRLEIPPDAYAGSWDDDEGDDMGQQQSNLVGAGRGGGAAIGPSLLDGEGGDEEQGEAVPDAPTPSQIAAATAASRLRSGARGID